MRTADEERGDAIAFISMLSMSDDMPRNGIACLGDCRKVDSLKPIIETFDQLQIEFIANLIDESVHASVKAVLNSVIETLENGKHEGILRAAEQRGSWD